jgi:hypothetical protein
MNTECMPINPPGIELKNISFNSTQQQIAFKNNRCKNPLPPLVQANFDIEESISISAVFFLDALQISTDVQVYWDGNVLKPNFYIAYNIKNNEAKKFTAYEVNFILTKEELLGIKPETIEVFVWDKDPITSRGTVTTVQSST